MKNIKLKDLSKKNYQRIINRSSGAYQSVVPKVREIMKSVKEDGDKQILRTYQNIFGKENYSLIQVTKQEINDACEEVDIQLIFALRQMVKNITLVQKAQLKSKKDEVTRPEKGIKVWREWRPIEKVGIYVPGGKAIYPSSLLMTTIPAKIAGCKEIIICTPPRENGKIPAATLVAADMIGVSKVYKVGGAEAIAAMAYGTETIPQVSKIFGAGNLFVTAAKMLALDTVSIDMPAGPSEVFIIADETANPAFIAADLLADGEHGENSACVLLTTSKKVAEETINEIEKQLPKLSTQERAKESLEKYGLIALVSNLDEAIEFTNEYAPEKVY